MQAAVICRTGFFRRLKTLEGDCFGIKTHILSKENMPFFYYNIRTSILTFVPGLE